MPIPAFTPGRRRLATLRLTAQRIGGDLASSPGDTVRWMLALQGQDLPGAKWSVGVRGSTITETAVDAAFASGEIVRSWPLRGTLHLVHAEDVGWMLDLTAARTVASWARRRAELGITEEDQERAREAAEAALSGRRMLTRQGLLASIETAGVSTRGQRGYHLIGHLALTGTVLLGPLAGRRQAFVLLDEWVRDRRRLERDEALGELALRYCRSHGPATERDLARWAGLTLGDVRRGLAICADRLTALDVDGTSYHLVPETLEAATPAARVHLLPGFDEYLLGYADRSAALAGEHAEAIVPGGNGMFRSTIVADGQVVGTWSRTVGPREVVIEPATFDGVLDDRLAEVAQAAQAFGAFLGRPARLAASGRGG
jgi:hypothetical protein